LLARGRVLAQQFVRDHQHARRAEPALQALDLAEGLRSGLRLSPALRRSTVTISEPSAPTASIGHDLTVSPSRNTVQVPQTPCARAYVRAGEAQRFGDHVDQEPARREREGSRAEVDLSPK
jgi:hypothetical protein